MSPADVSDADLLRRARAGGADAKDAYAALVARHQASAVRLATYLLAGSADAEDVAQEAFVRALVHLRRADESTTFGPWLRTILTRLCFNHRRNVRTRGESPEDDEDEQEEARLAWSARSAVEWTLGQLPYPYREILVLRFVEEMSIIEIADVLGIGESAAKMRLSRARESFQQIFSGEHGSAAAAKAP